MAIPKSPQFSFTYALLLLSLLMNVYTIFGHATPVNIPVSTVSDLLVQSALNSLNDNSPTGNTYKSGNLIRAQKLLTPPYVIYKLSLNLEPNCDAGASCPREACAIDLRQHEHGVIDLEKNSIQCMYLYPQSDDTVTLQHEQGASFQQDEGQQQDGATNGQEPENIESLESGTSNESLRLNHEVQTVADGNDRPFIAVRATDRNYCAGCPYELNPSLPGLAAYNEQVVQSMDDTGRSDYKHKVVSIVRVTRAVPPGSNVVLYELLLEIGETNCLRIGVSPRTDCALLPEAPIKLCLVTFEQRPWQQDSRKIVRNNCTDLPDTYNELTSDGSVKPELTSDSLYTSESTSRDRPVTTATRKDNNEKVPGGDPDSEQKRIIVDNVEPSLSTGASDTRHPVTENTAKKIIIDGPNLEDKKVQAFVDQYKEFDEFLKNIDFDGAIKNREKTPVEEHGTPVNEEIIRPKVAVRKNAHETPQENAENRAKRSLIAENESGRKDLVRTLAQLAVDELDYIDVDDRRRVLLDILDSRQQPGDDSLYYITMRVATSNCPENVTDCSDYSRDEVKICKAQIQTNPAGSLALARVLQSQCFDEASKRSDSRSRRHLLGGPTPKSINDPEVKRFADQALRKFSKSRDSENEPFLVEIVEATSQVVSGMKYKIRVRLGESTCSKGQREDCALRSDSPVDEYLITVWSQPWKDKGEPHIKIEPISKSLVNRVRRSSQVPGGVTPISPDDPKIREYAEQGLRKYSETFGSENEPYLVSIVQSSQQVVSGMLYKIRVRLGESTCPKGVKSDCKLKADAPMEDYEITVWSQPWIDHGHPDIKIKLYSEKKKKVSKRALHGKNYSQKMLQIAEELAHERAFERFMNDYSRTYESEEEKDQRFQVFRKNMKKIDELRKNEQGTAIYGATMFADLTPEEFRSRHLGFRPDLRSENDIALPIAKIPDIELPTEFDWRERNVITEVKDQGSCGSCWAFSVTGNVEALNAIKHGKLLSLSEQELVDCDKLDSGCEGGLPDNAYRAIEQIGGLELETDYPYDGEDEKCHFDKNKVRVNVLSGMNITSNETQMAQWLVQNGPISIGINANAMQFYMGGISHPFKFLCNGDNLDHGVLIVGYGIHSYPIFKKKMPYWIIKNSWGPRWGEQGYYRVYRGDGTCGLNRMATSAVIA